MAVLHSEPPQVFIAESEEAMSRLLALRLVARHRPADFGNADDVDEIRVALLAEEWAHAVELWLLATDEGLDVWGSEEMLWDDALDDEQASMEIRLAPIFDDDRTAD
ncbi:MAG TPA: hypothetical protein VFW97_18705 [Acidimicrobiia bacterium]|nr:hypothetical protein [Acidimicrobiia bacterium]